MTFAKMVQIVHKPKRTIMKDLTQRVLVGTAVLLIIWGVREGVIFLRQVFS